MLIHRLDAIQLRVLGCLIEKQRTTPEQYPLTLNALRLACNQATNREPVLELDESQVRGAAQSLGTLGWARLATGPGLAHAEVPAALLGGARPACRPRCRSWRC